MVTLLLLVFFLHQPYGNVAQLCYRPDGTIADNRYVPCAGGHHSMCCRTNDTLFAPDTCRLDGLCQSNIDRARIWRESCTDQSWKAKECLKLCIDGVRGQNDVLITFCPNQEVCCDYPNPSCCAQGKGSWIIDGEVMSTSPAPGSPTASARAATSSHRPPALVLSLAVALPILFLTLLTLIFFTFFRRPFTPNLFPRSTRVSSPHPPSPQAQQQRQHGQQSLQDELPEMTGLGRIEMAYGAEMAEAGGAERAEIAEGEPSIAELQESHVELERHER